jgi:hypothetical protein
LDEYNHGQPMSAVHYFLTAQAIYHIISLELLKEVLKNIIVVLHEFLCASCDKVSKGKFKVNWYLFAAQ